MKRKISTVLRHAQSLIRPGLKDDEPGWFSVEFALMYAAKTEDAGEAGMFYTAMGNVDEMYWKWQPLDSFERQCLRVMYLELLACMAEDEGK